MLQDDQLLVTERHSSIRDLYYAREWLFRVLCKHSDHYVRDYAQLGLICCCKVNEDVFGVQSDFGVLGVDDRRH